MRLLALFPLVFALGCAAPDAVAPPERPPADRPAPEQPPARPPDSPPPSAREIYIDSVTPTNPLVVKGRARTFENSVALRALDARGQLIVEDFTTSAGEMGHQNPYEARLWLVRDPGGRVVVEAFEYSAKDGSVQKLTRQTLDLPVEPIRATLFFPLSDCGEIRPFTRELPKSTAMARLLVEALLAGPIVAEKGATSPFPQGSDVRSVILREGVLTVDFNERLQNAGGSCRALAIRESVTRTLTQLPTVKRVVITAGGREDLALQP
jgi:hypothetical protein